MKNRRLFGVPAAFFLVLCAFGVGEIVAVRDAHSKSSWSDLQFDHAPIYLSEEAHIEVAHEILGLYKPILDEKNMWILLSLKFDQKGSAKIFNYPTSEGLYSIFVYGGPARVKYVNKDVIAEYVCHEIGHVLGGSPRYQKQGSEWSTVEGQADYFAGMDCLRRYFKHQNNSFLYMKDKEPDAIVVSKCDEVWGEGSEDSVICQRTALAAHRKAAVYHGSEDAVSFSTPSTERVAATLEIHPSSQCRLDTTFQGALCDPHRRVELIGGEFHEQICRRSAGDRYGVRPRCWFKPEDS